MASNQLILLKKQAMYPLTDIKNKGFGPVRSSTSSKGMVPPEIMNNIPKRRAQTGALAPVRINYPPEDARPMINKTVTSHEALVKAMGPPHRFGMELDNTDAKGMPLSREALQRHNLNTPMTPGGTYGGQGGLGPGPLTPGRYGRPPVTAAIAAMRATFTNDNTPDSPNLFGNLPRHAALRQFESPLITDHYAHGPLVAKRTPGGVMLGKADKRYVEYRHVPEGYVPPYEEPSGSYYEEDGSVQTTQTAGPDHPVVPYTTDPKTGTIVWAQCWDDEAGAVYYFNNATGEASWLPPEQS